MKYILGFIFGAVPGALATALLLIFNPLFDGDTPQSDASAALALSVAGQNAVSVLRTGTGYPWIPAEPVSVAEPAVDGTRSAVRVTLASAGSADRVAYVARVSTLTREGRPLFGEIIEQSMWHVVVPGAGSFFVLGNDDLWGFARRMALPFARGNDFSGKVAFDTTIGPARGGGRVVGLTGEYSGLVGSAELSQTVRRVSLGEGLTDAEATMRVSF